MKKLSLIFVASLGFCAPDTIYINLISTEDDANLSIKKVELKDENLSTNLEKNSTKTDDNLSVLEERKSIFIQKNTPSDTRYIVVNSYISSKKLTTNLDKKLKAKFNSSPKFELTKVENENSTTLNYKITKFNIDTSHAKLWVRVNLEYQLMESKTQKVIKDGVISQNYQSSFEDDDLAYDEAIDRLSMALYRKIEQEKESGINIEGELVKQNESGGVVLPF